MSLNLTTLFTRLGHVQKTIDLVNAHRGTTIPGRVTTIDADYASSDQPLQEGLYAALGSYQSAHAGYLGALQTLARNVLTTMVAEDQGVQTVTLAQALAAVVAAMQAGSETVKANAVGGSVAAGGTNTGNAVVAVGTKTRTGLACENSFAEALTLTCSADAVSGGATAGRELLTLAGQPTVADALSWLWPAGSGSGAGLQAIDAGQYQAGETANYLNNGDFEGTWTSNVPAGWHVGTGTAGTTVLKSTAQHYDGANSLQIAGNGSELTSVYQAFGTDTTRTLLPYTQYAVNCWVKTDSTPAAGTLRLALTDGAGAVVSDAQGAPNSVAVDLTTVGTSWVAVTAFFRTPKLVPATGFRLELKLTAALSNGVNCFVDRIALAQPVQAYPQGPSVAVFSASVPLIAADAWTVTLTNDRAGATQTYWDRLFEMRQRAVLLPSTSGSPTISDGLIA